MSRRRTTGRVVGLAAGVVWAVVGFSNRATDQAGHESAVTRSARRARAVLDRAIEAHGGEGRLRAIRTIWLEEEGMSFERPSPTPPFKPSPVRERTMLDFERGRGCHEASPIGSTPESRLAEMDYVYHPRTIVQRTSAVRLEMWGRTRADQGAVGLEELRAPQRYLPSAWLIEALEAAPTLRWIGEEATEGRRTHVIGLTTPDGLAVALRFCADRHLLTGTETLAVHPLEGDSVSLTEFADYRSVNGLMLPTRRITSLNGRVNLDVRAQRLQVDGGMDETCFVVPDGFEPEASFDPPAPASPMRLGDDVYLIQGLGPGGDLNALAVLFDTFSMVVEAPEWFPRAGISPQVMAAVDGVAAGRPLRYVTFSHHHLDHAGGIRDYVAAGVTVITTPANKVWLDEVVRAPFTLSPDRLVREPRPLKVELIERGRHAVEEGRQRVELHVIAWDHAREELFAYLPRQKLLFEGDLFGSGYGPVPVGQGSAVLLERRVRELGLDVQHVVGVHGKLRPLSELRLAIDRRTERLANPPR